MKLIIPIILILIAIGTFFVYTEPRYQEVVGYKAQVAEYDQALNNEMKLEQDRDALSNKYHSFPLDAEQRLEKMLPVNADNIRLVIDLQKIAVANGVNVVSTQFDSSMATDTSSGVDARGPQTDYGVFDREFSVDGPYENFLQFLRAMESNLRIIDVQAITFSSDKKNDYTFDIKVKTYWLKAQ